MTKARFLAGRGASAALAIVVMALFVALTFRVNAVRSDVHRLERQIVAVERERVLLETEYEARASQRQLSDWNEIDFGYVAPEGGQYVEGVTHLAQFGSPAAKGAPQPIRLARGGAVPESTGALASLARVLDHEALDRGRVEFGRAVAFLGSEGTDAERADARPASFNPDTARLAAHLTHGTRTDAVLSRTLARSGR